jgi:hypothetical protein
MITLNHILIVFSITLYILGRLCDDMAWYAFNGISA